MFCFQAVLPAFPQSLWSSGSSVSSNKTACRDVEHQMQSTSSLSCQESTDENFIAITESNKASVIAMCTSLMKQVHRMNRHSSEMVLFDLGRHMDRENTRVFLLLIHSAAGILPIGVLLLSNEQNETISCALRLYLSLLDDECFAGRGKKDSNSTQLLSEKLPKREVFLIQCRCFVHSTSYKHFGDFCGTASQVRVIIVFIEVIIKLYFKDMYIIGVNEKNKSL